MKHTPGTWAATTRQGSWDWLVYSADNPNIEVCQMFHDGTEENETGEANAMLVAAAPDLLAALETIISNIGMGGLYLEGDAEECGLNKARAAIAKASGTN